MSYNPDAPSTWGIKNLLEYALKRNVDIPRGCERTELVAIVEEHFADDLLVDYIRKGSELTTHAIEDVLGASTASILGHVVDPSYIRLLRRHPVKLEAVIEAGIQQLQSLPYVAQISSAQLHSPLHAWLKLFFLDCGDRKDLLTTFASASSDVAPSPVCGRFCQGQEMVVRCLDCGTDSTCVMCMDCFRHSSCVNHRYRITQSSGGGMCDCGDPTAWKPESFCSRHRAAAAAAAAASEGKSTLDPLESIAEEDRVWVMSVLRGVIQYISITLLQHMRLDVLQTQAPTRSGRQRWAAYRAYFTKAAGRCHATDRCSPSGRVSDVEEPPLGDVARISARVDWLSMWLSGTIRRLWELMDASDVAKRLVAQLWAEPVHMATRCSFAAEVTSLHANEEISCEVATAPSMVDPVLDMLPSNFTCVHIVFLYEASQSSTVKKFSLKREKKEMQWLSTLVRCVGHCLSVAEFRFPVGGLMATYAEHINTEEQEGDKKDSLSHYQIQVLTNPDVVLYLMMPAHLPYRAATNTVLHREMSSLLCALWLARDRIGGASANRVAKMAQLSRDGLVFVSHQAHNISLSSITSLYSCLAVSPAACYTFVVNRLAWRAFAQIAGSLAISGYIYKNPDAPSGSHHYPIPDFLGRCLSRQTWLWVHAMRIVLSLLLRMPAATTFKSSSAMPAISSTSITEGLGVPAEIWETWRGATAFDIPPDPQRQKGGLIELLSACRVSSGEDEALLLLERGPLATVQARVLYRQRLTENPGSVAFTKSVNEEEGCESSADASVMAAPAMATAMGYTIQALYEVSRTMDVVLEKQRDGFCRRCRSVVLERKRSAFLPTSRAAGIDDSNSQGKEGACKSDASATEVAQPRRDSTGGSHTQSSFLSPPQERALPSLCSMDIYEYALVEPHAHATTFSNHLPRIFGAVLTAWVIEHQRFASAKQSRSSQIPTAPTEVLTSTRITGLPGACTMNTARPEKLSSFSDTPTCANRPLRSLLDAFFQFRAEVTRDAQDRVMFSQQLLDALVMPHVLIGQVLDGLWRRDDYDVSSSVSMYLTYARSVSAEFDILMMQVLTTELAPADMALQILQRFSYAKRGHGTTHVEDASQARQQPLRTRQGQGSEQTVSDDHLHGPLRTPSAQRRFNRRCIDGYTHFLRLLLTIVSDTSKASFQAPMSLPDIERAVAHFLAHGKASHSAIVSSVNETLRSGDYGDADEDEKDSGGNVIKFSRLVDAAIQRLAVAEDSAIGKQFRLRDVHVWRAHVGLFQFGFLDSQVEGLHRVYSELVSAADMARERGEASSALGLGDGGDGANSGGEAAQQQRASLPPTQLSDTAMYAELVPTTRALLHTDAVLLPALYVLHAYTGRNSPMVAASNPDGGAASAHAAARKSRRLPNDSATHEGHSEGSDDERSSDDAKDTKPITREALLNATTALYLCVQDCVSICRAMRVIGGDGSDSAAATDKAAISWDAVELYLDRLGINEPSFTHASCAQWLPLSELVSCRTLLQKLQAPVRLESSLSKDMPTFTTCTSTDMLHRLRAYLRSNRDVDAYGCLEMVEAVLTQTGLATFDTTAMLSAQSGKDAAALSRKKVIQERQAMLMQRMRSRALKASEKAKTVISDGGAEIPSQAAELKRREGRGGTDVDGAMVSLPSVAERPLTGGAVGSLVGKLLLELTTVDCCVCRTITEEPLYLLCHTGSSDVLPRLGSLSLPDNRCVHGHLSMCGHGAHKSCVEKMFVRLSMLWLRWNFRSQNYLGPTEFNCPLCSTITTTLCPMPMLPSSGGDSCDLTGSNVSTVLKVSSPSPTGGSLFEEIQSNTVSAHRNRTVAVAEDFHTALANAAIGLSPSEDVPALVSTEDVLQRENEKAWKLSESIRTFGYACHLLLEAVKAGQDMSSRDLIGLFSLLTSITPTELQQHQAALRTNYKRNRQDKENLLIMDLLLSPRNASIKISMYLLTQVIPSFSEGCVEGLPTSMSDGSEDESTKVEDPTAWLDACFPDMIALWRIVGVLTLYKALVMDDAHHSIVLGSSTLTMAGAITLSTLNVASLQTPVTRRIAILRMLQYLLPVPHKSAETELRVVAEDVLAFINEGSNNRPTIDDQAGHRAGVENAILQYTTPEEWVSLLAEKLLHLPSVYATVLTRFAERQLCTICGREPMKPVLCCRCGKLMCMQPLTSPPELYSHTRACSGAVGIFLVVRTANFYVLELTSGRLYHYSSNYTDEYGEHDRNLHRGIPLFRNTQETRKLVLIWMLNKWGAQSSIFDVSNRMDLSALATLRVLSMRASSPHHSSADAASSPVSSPFVPCTEDSAHTRLVGRHLTVFQRTLDDVNYRYLTASSRLARATTLTSSSHDVDSVALPELTNTDTGYTAYLATLTENYQRLWEQRGLVPKPARREWFETVAVHLKALDALEATLAWLTDIPAAGVAVEASAAGDSGIGDGRLPAGDTGPISPTALYSEDSKQRKRNVLKKSAHDPLPLWYLWRDTQRHLHHMTLRLRPWTPASAGAYGTREAMRMSDLVRMDSSAFAWRVRQWCCISLAFFPAKYSDKGNTSKAVAPSPLTKTAERVHPGMIEEVVHRLSLNDGHSPTAALPLPEYFAAEEPEVTRMLLLCLGATPMVASKVSVARHHVAGALVYRMVLEVTLGRLRALPRCIFTWCLLRDVLRDYLTALAPDSSPAHQKRGAVLLAMADYVGAVVIPYLEHRDCHLKSLQYTAAQVHEQFTRLSDATLEQLHAAIAGADADESHKAPVHAQSWIDTEGTKENPVGLPEVQRLRMATLMEELIRCVCTCGASDMGSISGSLMPINATDECDIRCAEDIITCTILGKATFTDATEGDEVGCGHHCGTSTTSPGLQEDELFSIRRDFHRKLVDDSILHSEAARISQLRFFLYQYFTQSPSRSFDRVSRGLEVVATVHEEVGMGGRVDTP